MFLLTDLDASPDWQLLREDIAHRPVTFSGNERIVAVLQRLAACLHGVATLTAHADDPSEEQVAA